MKILPTLLLISFCSMAFGQSPYKQIADSRNLKGLSTGEAVRTGNNFYVELSKGELLTIKQHEEDVKRNAPGIKAFFQRDSVYRNQFLPNTITPYIMPGDTLESWKIVGEKRIQLIFKPKKK